MSAQESKKYILKNSGARPIDRDSVDSRFIDSASQEKNGDLLECVACTNEECVASGVPYGCCTGEEQGDCPPNPESGWPSLDINKREFTTPESPSRILSSGYTALEEFLHNHSYIVEGKVNSTCGDHICTVLADENCSNCHADCGFCPWDCVTEADNNPCDMIISDAEIDAFVDRWFRDEITITDLMEAMGHWKR